MVALLVMCDQLFLSPCGRRVALQSSSIFMVAIVTAVLSALTKSENLIAEFEIIHLQSSTLTFSLSSSESVRLIRIDSSQL
jgi:hypothetical protein